MHPSAILYKILEFKNQNLNENKQNTSLHWGQPQMQTQLFIGFPYSTQWGKHPVMAVILPHNAEILSPL